VCGATLQSLPLSPIEAFVLSRVDGTATVGDISSLTALPLENVVAMLEKLAGLDAVAWADDSTGPLRPPPRASSSAASYGASSSGPRQGCGLCVHGTCCHTSRSAHRRQGKSSSTRERSAWHAKCNFVCMRTYTRVLFGLYVGVLLLCANPTPASADDTTVSSEATSAPPAYRVDFDIFTPGAFFTHSGFDTYDRTRGGISGQLGVRAAWASGHGFFIDTSLSSAINPTYALLESGYLHRLRLTGDDSGGLGLEFQGGASLGYYSDSRDSAIGGVNAAISFDGRAGALVLGIMVRYRGLYDGEVLHHVTSAILRVTFGFWGS
jgi:hypothetical protein